MRRKNAITPSQKSVSDITIVPYDPSPTERAIELVADSLARKLSERAQKPPGGEHITLRMIWVDYQQSRKLKPVTLRNYKQRLGYLADWMDLPARSITKDMVEEKHRSFQGDATANGVMRTLRALFKYASLRYVNESGERVLPVNPVERLSEARAWRRDRRRTRHLTPQQLPNWFKGVYSIESATTRDVLLLLLFTGMRNNEVCSLRWRQVDLESGLIKLYNTKNGDDAIIPLSDFAWNLLGIRSMGRKSEYVFPGAQGSDHFRLGSKSYGAVVSSCGIDFSPHDLRRTFATIADELEIKTGVVKALMNHRSTDITDTYTIRSPERLRRSSQRITEAILSYAGMYWLTNARKSIQRLAFSFAPRI